MLRIGTKNGVLLAVIIILAAVSGCGEKVSLIDMAESTPFASFRDIPGVTQEEISELEAIIKQRDSFTYGMTPSSEAFYREDGEVRGFTAFFTAWLSQLFGVPFKPEIYPWGDLINGLETGDIDFAGNLTASAERRKTYFMTDAIARRSMQYMRLTDSHPLAEIASTRPPRYAFLNGTTTLDLVSPHFEGEYVPFFVDDYESAYTLLENGEADAFIIEGPDEAAFDIYGNVVSSDFFPLIYTPVSLSTRNVALAPVISVVQKALETPGTSRFFVDLYNKGHQEYMQHKLYTQLDEKERRYIQDHPVVSFVANYDNYPTCFYNTREEKWQGVFFDLLDEITAITGLSFKIINKNNDDWPVIYEMAKSGEASLIASLTWSREREAYFIWPKTAMQPDYFALISKQDYPDITIRAIQSEKVGLPRSTVHSATFRQWFPDHPNTVDYENMDEAIFALQRGEVDLVMSSQRRLMYLTHFLELPGYKTNIVFEQPIKTISGFNKNEEVLRSIFDKALKIIDTKGISERWMRKTYDYRAKVAEGRLPWLIGAAVLSLITLTLILTMFYRGRSLRKLKEAEAKIREADEKTKAMFDAMPLCSNYWTLNGTIADCNDEVVKLFDLKNKQEYIDRFGDLSPQYQPDGRPSAETAAALVAKAFKEGYCHFEWMMQKFNGEPVPTEVFLIRIKYQDDYIVVAYFRDLRELKASTKLVMEKTSTLTALFNSTPDMIFCKDINLCYTECNKAMEDYFDIRNSDIVGKHEAESLNIPPHIAEQLIAVDKKVIAERRTITSEEIIRSFDGRMLPFEMVRSPLIQDGEVTGLVGMARDITQRKAAEEELNRQHSLMDTVNMAAAVLLEPDTDGGVNAIKNSMEMVCQSVDADRVFLWINIKKDDGSLHYKQVCKWTRAEYAMGDDLPEYSYDEAMPDWKDQLFAGKNINGPMDTLPGYNPKIFSTYAMQSILIVPLFLKGEYWGFVSFDDCHKRRFFPKADEHILNSWGLLVIGAIQRGKIMLDLEQAVEEARRASSEAMKAYVETENALEAKGRFIANMNHEMRTPMNVIVGLTDLMLEEKEVPGKVKETLQKINIAGTTLMGLISDILDISKVEAGRMDLMPVQYHVASMLNDIIALNTIRAEDKPIVFKLDINEDLPASLFGDDLRVKQILNNLLSNAFKYTKEGTITLGVDCQWDGRRHDGYVWVSFYVSDTGIGIRKGDMTKLFSDYNQVDTRANRAIEGTGLGLSITKKFVELMDGEISVESEYGKGSTFRVRIRQGFIAGKSIGKETVESLSSFRYSDEMKQAQKKLDRSDLSYARVLVVDDFPTNLDVAAGMLRKYQMQVDCVTSGQESIDLIAAGEPVYDAIFMDHMMPEMDGVEAVKMIRLLDGNYAKNVPIIALTANAIAESEKMFLENGFNAFLPKPFNVMTLDSVVQRWVRNKAKEK